MTLRKGRPVKDQSSDVFHPLHRLGPPPRHQPNLQSLVLHMAILNSTSTFPVRPAFPTFSIPVLKACLTLVRHMATLKSTSTFPVRPAFPAFSIPASAACPTLTLCMAALLGRPAMSMMCF